MRGLSDLQQQLLDALQEHGPQTEPELANRLARHPSSVRDIALQLEVQGRVRRIPGLGGARKWRVA